MKSIIFILTEWFKGECIIATYRLEELMASKLRALYQRKKGRDLFDIWFVFSKKLADIEMVIDIFQQYCKNDGNIISGDMFRRNMKQKRLNKDFQVDMNILLPPQIHWDFDEAFEFAQNRIMSKI